MSRKTEATNYEKRISDLTNQIENIKKSYIAEAQKSGQLLSANAENQRLSDRQKLIDLIAQGKNLEAIKYLLETKTMLFQMEVRFADDKTRIAAEDELLEHTKMVVLDAVKSAKFNRKQLS